MTEVEISDITTILLSILLGFNIASMIYSKRTRDEIRKEIKDDPSK
jgi:hypothetical protein